MEKSVTGSGGDLRRAIQYLAGTHQTFDDCLLYICTVDSVDVPNGTCACTTVSGYALISWSDVQLMASVADGLLLVPAVGSNVIVVCSEVGGRHVVSFSELDRVFIVTGKSSIEVETDGITFNDGSYGGLIKIAELIKKLNKVENLVNDLITKFNTHIHPATSGTTSPTTTQETQTLTLTQQSEIENDLIAHGK